MEHYCKKWRKKRANPKLFTFKKAPDNVSGAFLKENSLRFTQVKSQHETQIFKKGEKSKTYLTRHLATFKNE